MSDRDDFPNTKREFRQQMEPLEQPLKHASNFYLLYYLTELRGVDKFSFDMKEVADDLYTAFRNYCVYALFDEARNANAFDIRHLVNPPVGAILVRNAKDMYKMEMEGAKPSTLPPVEQGNYTIETGAYLRFVRKFPDPDFADRFFQQTNMVEGDMDRVLSSMVASGLIVKRPMSDFEEFAEVLFSPQFDSDTEGVRWGNSFGGSNWRRILKTCARRHGLSKVAWVDQAWSLEHNTSIWLDEIIHDSVGTVSNPRASDDNYASEGYREALELLTGIQRTDRRTSDVEDALQNLLDYVNDGNMEAVWATANAYNSEVPYNTRRMKKYIEGVERPQA